MNKNLPRPVSDEERETYARDGVVCVRGVYNARWAESLLAAWDEVWPDPGAYGLFTTAQERQVTIGGTTYPFDEPFLVLATQNPIEQEGTYPLPEAQIDRFMLKVVVGYPSKEEERKIVDRMATGQPEAQIGHAVTPEQILAARKVVDEVFVDDKVKSYVVDLVHATRDAKAAGFADLEGMIEIGASPRASLFLTKAAKAHAFLQGRNYATPHDVKNLALDILRHRVVVTYEAEAQGKTSEDIIERILAGVLVP